MADVPDRPGLPWLMETFEETKHPRGPHGRWRKLGRGSSRSVYVFDHGGDLTKTETFGAALDPGDREWASVRFPPGTEPGLQNGENLDWHPTLKAAKAAVEPRARRVTS